MQNDTVKVAVSGFQQKLDSFKTKIELHQLLAQSLAAEFESLTSEFESLKQLFGTIESTSNKNESTSLNFAAASPIHESLSHNVESSSVTAGALSHKSEPSSPNNESLPPNNNAPLSGDTSPLGELAALIQRTVWESLKKYYPQPNIPNRMAQIVLALREREKLSVAQMRQITGASRESLARDIKVLKSLGWLEFHGSRKNGYFTLTASIPGFEDHIWAHIQSKNSPSLNALPSTKGASKEV